MNAKRVLDACCGGRMMWCDKGDPRILAQDIRSETVTMSDCGSERTLRVEPDAVADFREMPWEDGSFAQVLFDPPHLYHGGANSWLVKKYGRLDRKTWKDDIRRGFNECWRVLAENGTLVFKWNTTQLPKSEVECLFPAAPTFVTRQNKTYLYIFFKGGAALEPH